MATELLDDGFETGRVEEFFHHSSATPQRHIGTLVRRKLLTNGQVLVAEATRQHPRGELIRGDRLDAYRETLDRPFDAKAITIDRRNVIAVHETPSHAVALSGHVRADGPADGASTDDRQLHWCHHPQRKINREAVFSVLQCSRFVEI